MEINTVIFDMDGLLIDSEPYWAEAGSEVLAQFNVALTEAQFHSSTGLRTREWLEWWFNAFDIGKEFLKDAERSIVALAIQKIRDKADPMPGVQHIFEFFKQKDFRIGLASSSPLALIDVVVEKLEIGSHVQAITSAENLPYGKPHPQVYMQCAEKLQVLPMECVCFEDSFNGLISAKAARMKCVVIPDQRFSDQLRWNAADLLLSSLESFGERELGLIL